MSAGAASQWASSRSCASSDPRVLVAPPCSRADALSSALTCRDRSQAPSHSGMVSTARAPFPMRRINDDAIDPEAVAERPDPLRTIDAPL
jgi:hypothetical protein